MKKILLCTTSKKPSEQQKFLKNSSFFFKIISLFFTLLINKTLQGLHMKNRTLSQQFPLKIFSENFRFEEFFLSNKAGNPAEGCRLREIKKELKCNFLRENFQRKLLTFSLLSLVLLTTSCAGSKPYQSEDAKKAIADIDEQYIEQKIIPKKHKFEYEEKTEIPIIERSYLAKGVQCKTVGEARAYFLKELKIFLKTFKEEYHPGKSEEAFTPENLKLTFLFTNPSGIPYPSPNIAGVVLEHGTLKYMAWQEGKGSEAQAIHTESLSQAEVRAGIPTVE